MTRRASSYFWSYMSSRTVPAVVVMMFSGCSRALLPSITTSYNSLPRFHAASSSIMLPWTFRPSSVSLSDASGRNVASLKSATISPTSGRTRRSSTGDFFTMRFASSHTIFAWSRVVATAYTSAPASPSASIRYSPIADASKLLPFLRPIIKMASRYFRLPSISTKPNTVDKKAFSQSSSCIF